MKYCKNCGCKIEVGDRVEVADWEMGNFIYKCHKCGKQY